MSYSFLHWFPFIAHRRRPFVLSRLLFPFRVYLAFVVFFLSLPQLAITYYLYQRQRQFLLILTTINVVRIWSVTDCGQLE
jgi:hypothetical protein